MRPSEPPAAPTRAAMVGAAKALEVEEDPDEEADAAANRNFSLSLDIEELNLHPLADPVVLADTLPDFPAVV
jgi:hypothetical protein